MHLEVFISHDPYLQAIQRLSALIYGLSAGQVQELVVVLYRNDRGQTMHPNLMGSQTPGAGQVTHFFK